MTGSERDFRVIEAKMSEFLIVCGYECVCKKTGVRLLSLKVLSNDLIH